MAFCPQCGSDVGEADQFCEKCGHRLHAAGLSSESGERELLPLEIQKTATRTRALTIALVVAAAIAVISAVSNVLEMSLIERIRAGTASQLEADANDVRQNFMDAMLSVTGLVAGILWLMWQHRAQTNLRLRRPDAKYSPGWAVGWWFIPFANLFMPYRTIRELWQGSTSDGPMKAPSTLVSLWWVGFLGSRGLAVAASALSTSKDFDDLVLSPRFALASDLVSIAAALLAISLVSGIARGQLSRAVARIP